MPGPSSGRDPAGAVPALAIIALLGQGLFGFAWLVAGALEDGYSHERQPVSELAARHADHAWIMNLGLVAFAASFIALGLALRIALPRRRWAWAPPALFLAIGVGIALSLAFNLDCAPSIDQACRERGEAGDLSWRHYGHILAGLTTTLLIAATPFAFALALRPGRLARIALLFGLIALALGVGDFVTLSVDEDNGGIYQRTGLASVHGWVGLIAVSLLVPWAVRGSPSLRS